MTDSAIHTYNSPEFLRRHMAANPALHHLLVADRETFFVVAVEQMYQAGRATHAGHGAYVSVSDIRYRYHANWQRHLHNSAG